MKDNLFMVNEGSDKLMLVMTYAAMLNLERLIDSVKHQWSKTDDFAYFALSGGMSRKGRAIDGETKTD